MQTIEDIFNDDLFIEIERKKDEEIKASGWTREEIESMAKFIIKKR